MRLIKILLAASKEWLVTDMGHFAAAFSYYAPFALIPLILVSVGVSGFFYGIDFVKNIFLSWGTVFGSDLVAMVGIAVKNLDIEVHTYQIPIVATLFFCSVSILAFNALAMGFKKAWGIEEKTVSGFIKQSLRSFVFILILQIYIIVIISTEGILATLPYQAHLASLMVWFFTISAVFMLFYRFLVAESPSNRACIVGGITAGILFIFAKNLVTVYLEAKPVLTIFGAAGLILVLLVWIYVLAAIIYYGAIVAHLYDKSLTVK
jgi:membrane protein